MKINEVDFKKFNNTQLSEYDVNDHFMRFLNMKEEVICFVNFLSRKSLMLLLCFVEAKETN